MTSLNYVTVDGVVYDLIEYIQSIPKDLKLSHCGDFVAIRTGDKFQFWQSKTKKRMDLRFDNLKLCDIVIKRVSFILTSELDLVLIQRATKNFFSKADFENILKKFYHVVPEYSTIILFEFIRS